MPKYIPSVILALVAIGLLIGGASPAWWITGLVAIGIALVTAMSTRS